MVHRATITEMKLLFLQLKQLHELGWLVIRKLFCLRHFIPKTAGIVTEVLQDLNVFGHLHLVDCFPKLFFIEPIPIPLILENVNDILLLSTCVLGSFAILLLQNRSPGVGMEQGTVVGANAAVQFIEQSNLSTKLGRKFDAFTVRLLLLFSLFGVFWLFLLLLLLLLLLFQLFFFLVATIRLISRLKRVFKLTGKTVHHLIDLMLA